MNKAIESFRTHIQRVHRLTQIYEMLSQQQADEDFSDILRAQYVLAISILDMFIHELIYAGTVEILRGTRNQTKEYQKISITLNHVRFNQEYDWFESAIRRRLSGETYQNAKQIFEGMKLIYNDTANNVSESKLWEKVAIKLTRNKGDLLRQLNATIDRRNNIVHEADVRPDLTPDTLWETTAIDVIETIKFIEDIAEAIYAILTET